MYKCTYGEVAQTLRTIINNKRCTRYNCTYGMMRK
jgi:hypothetical protein